MRLPAVALILAWVGLALAGCASPTDRCDDAPGVHVALERPTEEPALYWVVELVRGGQEVDEAPGVAEGCVHFPAADGDYTVRSTYWVQRTDCWYEARRAFAHEERSAVALTDFTYQCE